MVVEYSGDDKINLNLSNTPNFILMILISLIAFGFSLLLLTTDVIRVWVMCLGILGGIISVFIRPYLGLGGIVFCYYMLESTTYSAGTEFLRPVFTLSLITLLSWILDMLLSRKFVFVKCAQHIAILGFYGSMLYSTMFVSVDTFASWYWMDNLYKVFLIYMLVVNLLNSFSKFNFFYWCMAGCTILTSLRGFRELVTWGGGRLEHLMGGEIIDSNGVAAILLIAIPFLIYKTFSKNKIEKWVAGIGVLLTVLCVTTTASRGGAVALIVMAIMIILRSLKNPKIILVFVGIYIIIICFTPKVFFERFETIDVYATEGSAHLRVSIWNVGIKIFMDHFIIGVGPDNFKCYTELYNPELHKKDPHNNFIKVAAENGIIGLFFYLLLLFSSFRDLWLIRKYCPKEFQGFRFHDMALSLETAIIGYLVTGFFCTSLYHTYTYWLFALVVVLKHLAKVHGFFGPEGIKNRK